MAEITEEELLNAVDGEEQAPAEDSADLAEDLAPEQPAEPEQVQEEQPAEQEPVKDEQPAEEPAQPEPEQPATEEPKEPEMILGLILLLLFLCLREPVHTRF